jgi:hypothetical protein
MEIYVDDEAKLTLHGLVQHYVMLQEEEKNRKLTDLLDALDFNQVGGGRGGGEGGERGRSASPRVLRPPPAALPRLNPCLPPNPLLPLLPPAAAARW